MKSLTPSEIEAVRSLLAAVVLADGRVHEDEVATYVVKLGQLIGEGFEPEIEARWLLENASAIRVHMGEPGGKTWLGRQVMMLDGCDRKPELLDAIWAVAISDNDLHDKETNIVDLAWGLWAA